MHVGANCGYDQTGSSSSDKSKRSSSSDESKRSWQTIVKIKLILMFEKKITGKLKL